METLGGRSLIGSFYKQTLNDLSTTGRTSAGNLSDANSFRWDIGMTAPDGTIVKREKLGMEEILEVSEKGGGRKDSTLDVGNLTRRSLDMGSTRANFR